MEGFDLSDIDPNPMTPAQIVAAARREDALAKALIRLRSWLSQAPVGTMLSAAAVLEMLGEPDPVPEVKAVTTEPTWRERIWSCPDDTRLGVRELADAVGRPPSWVYRHTPATAGDARLPHRKLDGELVFVAEEIRRWIRVKEEIIHI